LRICYYYTARTDILRFFKRLKLDYPQPETTRASRRFVKAMKRLDVSLRKNFNIRIPS
jgi:hypothetical protein